MVLFLLGKSILFFLVNSCIGARLRTTVVLCELSGGDGGGDKGGRGAKVDFTRLDFPDETKEHRERGRKGEKSFPKRDVSVTTRKQILCVPKKKSADFTYNSRQCMIVKGES